METHEKVVEQIEALLRSQHFGVLGTQGVAYPYCTLVGFAASPDLKEVLFATARDTAKYENVRKSPNVSLLIDSQTNRSSDIKDAQALTVLGAAYEVERAQHEEYVALYLKKLPYLEEFVRSSNSALIRIVVAKYIFVTHFENVYEYVME